MGSIRNLHDTNTNSHVLFTRSSLAEIYVYDMLKEKCGASRDSIYDITTRSEFSEMVELVNVQPFTANKWLFVIEYKKVKKLLADNVGIFASDTSEFLIKVNDYKEYKEVKSVLEKVCLVNDIYLAFIRFYDVEYLLRGSGLSEQNIKFVYKSYSSDPEQIFLLKQEINNGLVIKTKKDITNVCGTSSGTINWFAISLLTTNIKTEKGLKMVVRGKMKVAVELGELYGYSKFRNFLMSAIKDMIDIKVLYLNGVIYDRIDNIPEEYDISKLKKYQMNLKTIIDTPLLELHKLFFTLKDNGVWKNELGMLEFLYSYFEKKGVN